MNNQELDELLQKGDWEQALPKLKEYLAQDVEEGDKGRIFLMIAESYMKTATEMNQQESEAIQEILGLLKEVDKREQNFDDTAGLAQARSVLK